MRQVMLLATVIATLVYFQPKPKLAIQPYNGMDQHFMGVFVFQGQYRHRMVQSAASGEG